MNDEQLNGTLQSIGKECFVVYFHTFSDLSLSNGEVAEILVEERDYALPASRTRASGARRIIKAGLAKDALAIIAGSRNVTLATRNAASRIAEGL